MAADFGRRLLAGVRVDYGHTVELDRLPPMQLVYVVADVSADQELGVTYIEPFGSRAQRRRRLQDRFGFLCGCPSCTLDGNSLQVQCQKTASA